MLDLKRVAATLVVTGATALAATAQPPAPPTDPQQPANTPAGVAAEHQLQPYKRRTIVQHYPQPYPEYYHGDQSAGFRNPGGTGRYMEYYPPGNQFQERGDPVRVAQFDTGYGNRSEQLASQQIGIQRENAIMNHIDRYARPAFGVGFFGGFY